MTYHTEWAAQARRDLEVAKHLLHNSYYEWAAYAAQQAAEKAVKALRIALGTDVKEIKVHEMSKLLGTIPSLAPHSDPLLGRAGELDEHNQQSRYPGLRGRGPDAPMNTYTRSDAEDVIGIAEAVVDYADQILRAAVAFWAGSGSSGAGPTPGSSSSPSAP